MRYIQMGTHTLTQLDSENVERDKVESNGQRKRERIYTDGK